MKNWQCLVCGLTVVVVAVWFWISRDKGEEAPEAAEGKVSATNQEEGGDKPRKPKVQVIDGSPFTLEYDKEGGSAENDLKVLMLLLHDCQLVIKNFDEYLLPDNPAIVSFLQGDNRDRLAWIPPDHSSVNEKGELMDRWQTPVFFHRESGLRFSLRSAGPDLIMWTDDDIVVE